MVGTVFVFNYDDMGDFEDSTFQLGIRPDMENPDHLKELFPTTFLSEMLKLLRILWKL